MLKVKVKGKVGGIYIADQKAYVYNAAPLNQGLLICLESGNEPSHRSLRTGPNVADQALS